jgi:hypothetical protein
MKTRISAKEAARVAEDMAWSSVMSANTAHQPPFRRRKRRRVTKRMATVRPRARIAKLLRDARALVKQAS